MKVRLIKPDSIESYISKNSGSKKGLERFMEIVKQADWNRMEDIQYRFGSTMDTLPECSRVIFDIGGNKYRLICKLNFKGKKVTMYVKFIGTHAEYDKVCKEKLQCTIDMFKAKKEEL